MLDYVIMGGILAALALMLLFGAKYHSGGYDGFFGRQDSKAMRGFWCLIVILVHIPQEYRNWVQDMIGSFAFIGVTFFFMTSAYGLSAGARKNPGQITRFWTARLPKLLIPNWITNIASAMLFFGLPGRGVAVGDLAAVHSWVKWLLGCYLAFWIGYRFVGKEKLRGFVVCTLVMIFSVSFYCLQYAGVVKVTTWCTEVFGFVWGILLLSYRDQLRAFFLRKWFAKVCAFCLLSLILGGTYLLFKGTAFWGDYVLKIALGCAILCFILVLNGKIQLGNKLSRFLGDISFEIYLLHGAVFQLLQSMLPGLSSGLFILGSVLLTVLLSALVHKICAALLTWLSHFLLAGETRGS